jgi:transposase InsO family protein
MSFQLVAQLHKEAAVVDQVCRVLEVSRSGYYAARKRAMATPKLCLASVQLKAEFAASGQSYGSRRLRAALELRGVSIGRHRVRMLMSKHRLRPVWKRKFVHTTDSRHALPVSPNVLARRFDPAAPNQAWVADITYIRTRSGWLYLAAVLDLYSRKIVGWAMAPHMEATLVCSALHMAIAQRKPPAGLIVHSDRGCQYASTAYQKLLSMYGLVGSMSRKGNCWDNAVMERFFLNLKMERVWQRDYANHGEATADIADYVVAFYNSVRLHSKLGNLPPNAYERKTAIKQPIVVS